MDARALTDFLRHHREHIERLQTTGRPELLTIAGRPALVMRSAESHGEACERLEYLENVVGLWKAHREPTSNLAEGLMRLRERHGLDA